MLATAAALPRPDEQDAWAFEMKWDGMRAVAAARTDGWQMVSRTGRDLTSAFPELGGPNGLGDLARRLGGRSVVVDGEIVALDELGRPSFGRLQQRIGKIKPDRLLISAVPVVLIVFDLLAIDDVPAVDLAFADRRRLLEALEIDASDHHDGPPEAEIATMQSEGPSTGPVKVPPLFVGDAARAWALAESLDLEGVVAKRLDSPYVIGKRSTAWRKVKRVTHREFIVVGWVGGEGRRAKGVGALVLAAPHNGELRFVGRVGTGFSDADLDRLLTLLEPIETTEPPVVDPARARPPRASSERTVHWVQPRLVGEVAFLELPANGSLRHPVWRGLRPDKSPEEVEPLTTS